MVLVLSLALPSRKWLMLACGWGEFEVAWWESPERLGPPPSKRSLDHLSPPFIFSQDFILAKSGLIRAAFTKLLPHFSQRGVKSYLQPPHNTIIYHKSSCCIYPTPHPLEALRAWDQVRMPLWVLLPPCGCPFKKEATLCIWFLSLPLAPPPTLVQKPIFLAVVFMGRCAPGTALMGAFSLSVSGHIPWLALSLNQNNVKRPTSCYVMVDSLHGASC